MTIEIKDVTVTINGTIIVSNITHTFTSGRCHLITGGSGSGKTTLIKLAAGLILPATGHVFIDSVDYSLMDKKGYMDFRKKSGFLFQDSALWANKSLWDNMALPLQYHHPEMKRNDINARIIKLTDFFNLQDDPMQRPALSSQGEQKLYSFIRSVIHEPEMLYLDQPFGSIDDESKKRVHGFIQMLKEQGHTLIISSNNREKLESLADHTLQLSKGQIISASGRTDI